MSDDDLDTGPGPIKVFFVSPIGPRGSEVRQRTDRLTDVIVEAFNALGPTEVGRADRIASPGLITSQIVDEILDSAIVVVDISDRNPNVMYELGIVHSAAKVSIVLVQEGEAIPFDVAAFRTIVVPRDPWSDGDREQLVESVRKFASRLLTGGAAPSTPVDGALRLAGPQTVEHDASGDPGYEAPIADTLKTTLAAVLDLRDKVGALGARVEALGRDATDAEYSRRIFIVHGHDDGLKFELSAFLQKLRFDPIILHEQPDKGQTIFTKLHTESANVGYAFILLTPDDEGRPRGEDQQLPRARQNVVFEHGLFVGSLSPDRVCAIVRDSVEIPSDLAGLVYKRVLPGGGLASIALDIVNELKAAGYRVDMDLL